MSTPTDPEIEQMLFFLDERDDDLCRDAARTIRAISRTHLPTTEGAGSASVGGEGFVLVPREPSASMLVAGKIWLKHWQHMREQDREGALSQAYAAMLKAVAPQVEGEG